jgi:hypothetical protein
VLLPFLLSGGYLVALRLDEVLDMSRRMNERLKQLQKRQGETIERLEEGLADLRGVVLAAGDVVRVP